MASAALIASRRVMTARAHESKSEQEQLVKDRLIQESFKEVPPRDIPTLDQAPELGEFCGESMFGSRKADVVIRLWDRRVLALECKVSNSSTNSVKRLNNDAAVKAGIWLGEFGTAQTVPAAMLAGVFKRHNLEQAQGGGLTLFWSHDLDELTSSCSSATVSYRARDHPLDPIPRLRKRHLLGGTAVGHLQQHAERLSDKAKLRSERPRAGRGAAANAQQVCRLLPMRGAPSPQ